MCICPFRKILLLILKRFLLTDCGRAQVLTEVEIVGEDTHVNEDIVWLSLIKMFPLGCRIHGLIKNVITDSIKRSMMIHDNNYAVGKTTACDLINVQDTGNFIPEFITDKSG